MCSLIDTFLAWKKCAQCVLRESACWIIRQVFDFMSLRLNLLFEIVQIGGSDWWDLRNLKHKAGHNSMHTLNDA